MKIEVKIDERCTETRLIVVTEKMTDEVSALLQRLSGEEVRGVMGFDGDIASLLEPDGIVRIYAAAGKVFAVTDNGEYLLRLRLYEAEGRLDRKSVV